MKVVFLGTNGWYDTETGNTVCILIEVDDYFIILDAGNGFHKVDRYITDGKPIYLFLSHFHLDHIIGFHVLSKFNFTQGIRIYGQPGTKSILNTIINKPYTIPFDGLPFKVEVHELSEGSHKIPFPVECKVLLHSSKCFGYRFEFQDRVIAYCPDTGVCDNIIELANKADLLISECSSKSGEYNEKWPHLNPENAAQIAKQAGIKQLALIHFGPVIYKTFKERKLAEKQARKIFQNTFVAYDDMLITV